MKPDILSREDWKAKKPTTKMKKQIPKFITIHHTATYQKRKIGIENKMRNLQNFSQSSSFLNSGKHKPAWADIPYHFYIDANGKIAEGREIQYVGDTNTQYDLTGHIQLVLEGNFEEEYPSHEQIKSVEQLSLWLILNYGISLANLKGHKDYASTLCPGKNLKMNDINEKIWNKIKELNTNRMVGK